MAQIFSKDAQGVNPLPNIPSAAPFRLLLSNFLTPPFGNCKAVVKAVVSAITDATQTEMYIDIYRNPDAENILVAEGYLTFAAAGGVGVVNCAMGVDPIPDGRDVQYALVATCTGATGPMVAVYGGLEVELISG
jgi:hypothetical protein